MEGRTSAPGVLTVLGRGFARRCPRCGQGHLFRRWFDLVPRCPRCDLPFERGEGYWLGAIAINIGATEAVFAVFLVAGIVLTWPHVPWVALTVLAVAVNAAFPVFFYPFSKTLFIAVDVLMHRMDPVERHEPDETSTSYRPW